PNLPQLEYFAQYHRIDIALDTFPYPGHTTTCDCLWMGVPIVTLPWKTAVSRGGVSILHATGLTDWIARSPDDYVDRVLGLASNLQHLAELRASLRQRLIVSPLIAADRFARHLAQVYRLAW